MRFSRYWLIASFVLLFGFALRLWLAFDIFKNQGFAWDMATFASWSDTIYFAGFDAYRVDPSINYPPAFADILIAVRWLAELFGLATYDLLKLPAIVADIAIAALLAYFGRKWFSAAQGLIAATLYLLIPVTWYDSAIWGQVDSLAALFMLLSVIFIIDRRPELAFATLAVAVLIKPQGALAIFVLLPVFLGQMRAKEFRWHRPLSAVAAGIAAFALIAMPWSLESYLPAQLQAIPLIGDLGGLAFQYLSTAGLFPVLTANAFNGWALVGDSSLASQMPTSAVSWMTDNLPVFGVPAGVLGGIAFLIVAGIVFWRLLSRRNPSQVLTGFALLLVAFFVLPTRVHERYLVQAFAVLALIWASRAYKAVLLSALAIANTINLHAILAADLQVQTIEYQSETSASGGYLFGLQRVTSWLTGGSPEDYSISWVRLPAEWARQEWLIFIIVAIHTAAFIFVFIEFLNFRTKSFIKTKTQPQTMQQEIELS